MNTTHTDWMKSLATTRDGRIRGTPANLQTIIANDDGTRGRLWLNELDHREYFDDAPLDDRAVDAAMPRCAELTASRASLRRVREAMEFVAKQNPRNPAARWLRSLRWDGVARLDALASRALGNDSPDAAKLLRGWMLGAVGCLVHPDGWPSKTLLVLQGREGVGKSLFMHAIAGDWLSELTVDTLAAAREARRSRGWIAEVAVLATVENEGRFERVTAELLRQVLRQELPEYLKIAAGAKASSPRKTKVGT